MAVLLPELEGRLLRTVRLPWQRDEGRWMELVSACVEETLEAVLKELLPGWSTSCLMSFRRSSQKATWKGNDFEGIRFEQQSQRFKMVD